MKKFVSLAAVMLFLGFSAGSAFAGFAAFTNGDFETSDLTGWISSGDAGVADVNVLNGLFSAFISNEDFNGDLVTAVGGVCSNLQSGAVFPTRVISTVAVSFKVRYKTNESIGPITLFQDPFQAMLKTGLGTVNLVTITTSGITRAPDVAITRLDTGAGLAGPPTLTPFLPGVIFDAETPSLQVSTSFAYSGCDPVSIEFMICDDFDTDVMSAAFIDDVVITAVSPTPVGGISSPRLAAAPCILNGPVSY